MTNEEIIEVLDDMKVKIHIPEAAVTQLKRNAALDEAIKRFKEPQHIRIVDSAEVAATMAPVDVHNYLYWSRILSEIEKLGFSFCKIERSNDE